MDKHPKLTITRVIVKDIRFPTSLEKHGSDAMHPDPDYSCAYVLMETSNESLVGHALTFTIGRGTEVVVKCIESLAPIVVGRNVRDITRNFASFYRDVTSDTQLRWIGPEKGVAHLAASSLINAVWDLWAVIEKKPLWRLLCDMSPEQLVSCIDFRYISDAVTKEEAVAMLKKSLPERKKRIEEISKNGYPAYTTTVGWIGYSDEVRRELCRTAMAQGYRRFKAKVGDDVKEDKKRLALIRSEVGYDSTLMVDANQKWDVATAISHMKQLAEYKPLWIEEPTSPDDILGHAAIAKELNPLGIGVATGEQCHNRVMFKQFMSAGGMQYCQLDSTRLGGVNEVVSVILMAHKFGVPVCPHAGGVGLCEYVPHLAIFDYVCVSGDLTNRMTEYCEHLHEHFANPPVIVKGNYSLPPNAGYCGRMLPESISAYEFPNGSYWKSRHGVAPLVPLTSGVNIPLVGLGTWKSTGPGDVYRAVKHAIVEAGYRHIDCAFLYENEGEVGRALAEVMASGAVRREDLFITSKVWNTFHSTKLVKPALAKTLSLLKLDYVDLYLVHWPYGLREGGDLNPTVDGKPGGKPALSDVDYLETWVGMEECFRAGMARAIGVSNFNSQQLTRLMEVATVQPVCNQVECHPYLSQERLIKFCRSKGITVVAYSPLGSPDRPWAKPGDPSLLDDPAIKEIANRHGKSPAQILVKWQAQRGVVVIPKSVTSKRISDNIDIWDFDLSPKEMATIAGFNRNYRFCTHEWAKGHKYYPFDAPF